MSGKWFGCCPSCNQWDTLSQQHTANVPKKNYQPINFTTLNLINTNETQRISTGIHEWDRVTGGGLVPGAFVLLTGDPGIGKSTLLLHISAALAQQKKVFYISSEESRAQVKARADRLDVSCNSIHLSDQAELEPLIATVEQEKPDVLIIDSIQNCIVTESTSAPGSVAQLRESTFRLMRLAKQHRIIVILSGHITKEGVAAGPKILEHMVDAVFYLQGEDRWRMRTLRAVKNRFGTINEIGFFEMEERGLIEVPHINHHLMEENTPAAGSALISSIEGSRPVILELQALTNQAHYGMPQRVISGIEHKQVMLIAAILEKHLAIKLTMHDIFIKLSGGIKIKGYAADLSIALALLSSFFQQPLPSHTIALGELSLTGKIKPINHIDLHLNEIAHFGIKNIYLTQNQKVKNIAHVTRLNTVHDLLSMFE